MAPKCRRHRRVAAHRRSGGRGRATPETPGPSIVLPRLAADVPHAQIVQANRAIGALLKDKDTLSEDLKTARQLVEKKDEEVAALRAELARRDQQLATLRELLGQGLDLVGEDDGGGKNGSS